MEESVEERVEERVEEEALLVAVSSFASECVVLEEGRQMKGVWNASLGDEIAHS